MAYKIIDYKYTKIPVSIYTDIADVMETQISFLYDHGLSFKIKVLDTVTNDIYYIDMLDPAIEALIENYTIRLKELVDDPILVTVLQTTTTEQEYNRAVKLGNHYRMHAALWVMNNIKDSNDIDISLKTKDSYLLEDISKRSLFTVNGLVHYDSFDTIKRTIVLSEANTTITKSNYSYLGRIDCPAYITKYQVTETDVSLSTGATNALNGIDISLPNPVVSPAIVILGMLFIQDDDVGFSINGNTLTISLVNLGIVKLISYVSGYVDLQSVVGSPVSNTVFNTITVWKKIMNHPLSFVVDIGDNNTFVTDIKDSNGNYPIYTGVIRNSRKYTGANIMRTGQYLLPVDSGMGKGKSEHTYRLPARTVNPIVITDGSGEIVFDYDTLIKDNITIFTN